MDKSPWDRQNVTSILGVSQVLSQKAVLSFYKSMSPPPSPPNTMLKDQRNCASTVSTRSVGWGEGVGRTVLVARGYNFACVKKRSNCTTVPRLLSMIVGKIDKWYEEKEMRRNHDKYKAMVMETRHETLFSSVKGTSIPLVEEVELLGVTVDIIN